MGIESIEELKPGTHPKANGFISAVDLKEVLGMLAGAASVCWDKPEGAGIFHSEKAAGFVDEALERIHQLVPLHHTDETLLKVYNAMTKAGLDSTKAQDAIMDMQNAGVYFREVK